MYVQCTYVGTNFVILVWPFNMKRPHLQLKQREKKEILDYQILQAKVPRIYHNHEAWKSVRLQSITKAKINDKAEDHRTKNDLLAEDLRAWHGKTFNKSCKLATNNVKIALLNSNIWHKYAPITENIARKTTSEITPNLYTRKLTTNRPPNLWASWQSNPICRFDIRRK